MTFCLGIVCVSKDTIGELIDGYVMHNKAAVQRFLGLDVRLNSSERDGRGARQLLCRLAHRSEGHVK